MRFLLSSAPNGSSGDDDVVTVSEFQSFSEEAVRKIAVASMKTCALDPFPSSILLLCIEELLPVVTRMVNISLEHGCFADEWKNALVHHLLKNFRPVSISIFPYISTKLKIPKLSHSLCGWPVVQS